MTKRVEKRQIITLLLYSYPCFDFLCTANCTVWDTLQYLTEWNPTVWILYLFLFNYLNELLLYDLKSICANYLCGCMLRFCWSFVVVKFFLSFFPFFSYNILSYIYDKKQQQNWLCQLLVHLGTFWSFTWGKKYSHVVWLSLINSKSHWGLQWWL